jgi:sialic acid synthase SpsE
MLIADFDTAAKVLIIAEIGNNHEGSYALAEELVGRAAEAGADAVKFQTFRTEEFVSHKDEARFRRLKAFELSQPQFEQLAAVARRAGVMFLSTPLDLGSAEFLAPLVSAFKIASGDNTFYPLLDTVARLDRPVILSGGLTDTRQLTYSRTHIEQAWRRNGLRQQVAVLHCVTSYPVAPEQANLAAIATLVRELGGTIGYSDHTLGIEAPVLAVASGARIVEKHFTIDHSFSDFRDHQLSADPVELAELVRRIRQTEVLLGSGEKLPQECERAIEGAVRRSIVARCDLPAGTVLRWEHLGWLRPGGGIPPGQEHHLVGRTLNQTVAAGTPLRFDHVEKARTRQAA